MATSTLTTRTVLTVAVAALIGLVLGGGVGFYLSQSTKPFYRAEVELAMLPATNLPPEQISNYWEALARGQAPRVAAEVLNQPRWKAPAAEAAGVDQGAVTIDAGVVTDTTLITVGVGAPTADGAEKAVTAAVAAATPLAQQVSGPFTLQVVQPADGTAKMLSTPGGQVIAIAALAGIAAGAGIGLLIVRRRPGASAVSAAAERPAAPSQARPYAQPAPPVAGMARPGAAPLAPPRPRR